MNRCRKWNKLMIDAYYGELNPSEKAWFDLHLEKCQKCQNEWNEINSTLTMMDCRSLQDPGKTFWNNYWENLADKFNQASQVQGKKPRAKRPISSLLPFPAWAVRTAAVLGLIVIGVYLGKIPLSNFHPADIVNTTLSALDKRTSQYLESSKLMMLGFDNFDPETEDIHTLNLPLQKEKSDRLIKEASYLKVELQNNSQHRLYQLVSDLEMILLQIANLEAGQGITAVELVKSGVENKSVLFKINMEEMKKLSEQNSAQEQQTDKKTI